MVTRAVPSANTSRYGQASIYFLLAGLSVTFIVVSLFDVISFADLSNVPLEEPAGAPFSTSGAVTVLHWTDWFDNHLYAADTVRSCPRRDREGEVTCTITSDRSALNRAEAVVFHARNIELKKMPPSRASPSQIWIYWSEENPLYDHRACGWYYRVKWWERQCDKVSLHAERLALFNLRMGYQTDSDIVAPYIRNSMKRFTDQPMAPLAGKKNAVVWVANNCNSLNKREKYIAALMKHYPVHSYGDCMRNVPGKESFVSEEETLKIVQQYKFAFAWENANCKDYVTEKLERVFQAGVLPIVDGPDDYSAFVPNNHSVIQVADFAGPKALADFLRRLEQDDELYLRYFEYKPPASNYDPAFLAYNADNDSECQLCRAVVEEAERLKRGGSQRVVQLDDSCKRRWWDREFYDDGTMAARPTERWIEEWGFGGEDLVIWAVLGGTVFLLLLLLRARSRILKSRMLSSFCKS